MRRRQHGLALVIVLWVSLLLALLAGSFAFAVRTETRVIAGAKERAEARALAAAAVQFVGVALLDTREDEMPFPLNGQPFPWAFAGRALVLRVGAAGGRIDVNKADKDVLVLALQQAGVPEERLDTLSDAILDWRDRDDARLLNGAEAPDYAAAGIRPGPKDADFESVDEVGQVLGMTPAVLDRLRPMLTVHGSGGIDPRYAPKEVLLMLGDGDEALVDELVASDNADLTQRLPWTGYQTGRDDTLHVDVEVPAGSGARFRFSAVISTGRAPAPVSTLEWRE